MVYYKDYGVLKERASIFSLLIIAGILALMASIGAFNSADAAKPNAATTIQSGLLKDSAGETITTGYDQWGYNYQARMFNGKYCDAYRDDSWCQEWKNDDVIMKWNDAWLSNASKDSDELLDRHYGFPSYIGSGAWLTNHISGTYQDNWNIGGEWTINVTLDNLDYPETLILTQNGTNLTGSLELVGGGSLWTIDSGSVNGTSVQFSGFFAANTAMRASFTGEIAVDGTLSGEWEDTAVGTREGTWKSTAGVASSTTQTWNYFTKIVAVPADARLVGGIWETADGVEIGQEIWGEFAVIQEVSNDTGTGGHGLLYKSALRSGLGNW